jgi:hypothetical protein
MTPDDLNGGQRAAKEAVVEVVPETLQSIGCEDWLNVEVLA